MTATAVRTLEIINSDSPQSPTEYSKWQVYSFGLDKITDVDRDDYVRERTGKNTATAANIGLATKLKAKTAFWLSYYEHGDGAFSLAGEGNTCPWDSTGLAGILVWEGPPRKLKDDREAAARAFLEVYNKWANGNVYSWQLLDGDGDQVDGQDECYDEKEMFDSIREAVAGQPVLIDGEAKWLARFHGEGLSVVDEDGDPVDLKSL